MATSTLRVASYNIRKCIGLDWKRKPERIMSVIADMDADIVVLQEVDKRFGERAGTLSAYDLEYQLGYRCCDIAIRSKSIGWHGNAVLYNKSVEITDSSRITLPNNEPRGAISACMKGVGFSIRVIGTHLSLFRSIRNRQMDVLIDDITSHQVQLPTLLAGDFNEYRAEGPCRGMLPSGFKLITPGASFHSLFPRLSLDRFLIYGNIEPVHYQVYKSKTALRASDHMPIVMDVAVH